GDASVDHVGTLAARIAHDFNSLLAPVIGNVILLEEDIPGGPLVRQRVMGIREATEAARSFAQRLMALDPRRKLPLEAADLGRVVRDCLPAVRAAVRAEIVIDGLHEASADSVRVNPKQIEHAIVQLALNAQDAMPSGGKIALSLDAIESKGGADRVPAGRWVRLRVRDNGRGMEPSMLVHAFDPFVTTKVPGCAAGLGLPTVVAIVRQHGGMIDVESSPGKGATFSIYLPSYGVLAPTPATPDRVPAPRAVDSRGPGFVPIASVLLVEDNGMVRRSVEVTLHGMGYRVTAVESGERCLEVVRDLALPLDLLITDVVMPEMSGKELILRVHAMRPGLPVLFMSGYDRSTLASRKQGVTAEHFLQKPFDSEDLSLAVRKAIGDGPAPHGSSKT
ncbi:MAG TPA: ATP-binding protein, partial [Polyangia bacterium]